jgi:hypothetical protein
VLKADGYLEYPLEVIPSRDKSFEVTLEEKKRARSVIDLRDPWKKQAAGQAPGKPPTAKKGKKSKSKKSGLNSPDLKDPMAPKAGASGEKPERGRRESVDVKDPFSRNGD